MHQTTPPTTTPGHRQPNRPLDYGQQPERRLGLVGQVGALLLDGYRQLNAARLFWVTLGISGLLVVVFLLLGITEEGVTFAGFRVLPFLTTEMMSEARFYKLLFTNLGVGWWLTLGAVILALISTASLFPDLMSGGAIDLYLSKPLSRWTLFLTKYVTALLFVALQVAVFCTASFLVIGLRGGEWVWGIFLAVPLVVLFYSYIYVFCTLFGVISRSTLAAILLTVLVWFGMFLVGTAEFVTKMFALAAERQVEQVETFRGRYETRLSREMAKPEAERNQATLSEANFFLNDSKDDAARAETNRSTTRLLHNIAFGIYTVTPKTGETTALIERWIIDFAELRDEDDDFVAEEPEESNLSGLMELVDDPSVTRELVEERRERSWVYIIGTSLAAEAVLLLLSGWIFVRRDY